MKERSSGGVRLLAVLALVAGLLTISSSAALADGSLNWNTKNGANACTSDTTGTVLWIFNPHSDAVPTELYINGNLQSGSWTKSGGSQNWHFTATIPGTFGNITSASVTYTGTLGDNPIFTISGCNEGGGGAPPAVDLTVRKTASGTFKNECSWTITKTADPTKQTVGQGQDATFSYTVVLTGTCGDIKNVQVSGTITVSNTNNGDVTIDTLTDELSDGTDCSSSISPSGTNAIIPANGSKTFDYTCSLPDGSVPTGLTNTATITWSEQTLSDGSLLAAGGTFGDADVNFTGSLIDDCATVTDSVDGGAGTSLGDKFCVEKDGGSKTFNFNLTFQGPAGGGVCQDHNNTATFTDNSDPVHTGSASATVTVCNPFKASLTIGYWKTHMHLCARNEKQAAAGCSTNGPFTKTYLGQSICNGCATVGVLGTYNATTEAAALTVFNANNCSNASTSDANAANCLAAQLLAAELNVANGADTCICNTIKQANALLTAIGYAGPTTKVTFSGSGYTRANTIALKTALDTYNNNHGC